MLLKKSDNVISKEDAVELLTYVSCVVDIVWTIRSDNFNIRLRNITLRLGQYKSVRK